MRTPTLIMTLGLPGSGKSTWAEQQVRQAPPGTMARVTKDALRAMVHAGVWAGRTTEKQIEAIRDAIVIDALGRGQTVIVDDTNLHPAHETRLREIAALHGAIFRIQDFTKVPIETCIERDAQRTGTAYVGAEVILKQARVLANRKPAAEPLYPQPYIPEPGLPTCYLFDVDGTLALMDRAPGGRRPYDWHRVGEDLPNEPVVEMAQMLHLAGETIIVFSGREDVCYTETQEWMDKFVVPDLPLFMRAAGDRRPDDLVKFEMFQQHIAGRFRVKAVWDDRDRVISMYRRILGLPVWQVNYGNF